jgi:hypothetical protein
MTEPPPIPPVGPPVSPPAIETSAAELSNEALVAQLGAASTDDRAIALALLVRRGPPAAGRYGSRSTIRTPIPANARYAVWRSSATPPPLIFSCGS